MYISKYKIFFANVFFYSLYYNIYSGCCKKRPPREQVIQSEIDIHNNISGNRDSFFKKTNTKKSDNANCYSLFENVDEITRINFKINKASSSADFDKILNDINDNEVLSADIKKSFIQDVTEKRDEARNREDEFNKALNAEIKDQQEIINLFKNAKNNTELKILEDKLKTIKPDLFKPEELEKLKKSIKNKGLDYEFNEIRDFLANKKCIKLTDIDEEKNKIDGFIFMEEKDKNNFKNMLDNTKKELEDLEKAKKAPAEKQNKIENLLKELNPIEKDLTTYEQNCESDDLEKLKECMNGILELETRIVKINITGFEEFVKNLKDDLTERIKKVKIKSAENYIDKCVKIEDLDNIKLDNYVIKSKDESGKDITDETDKKNLETKINSKRESLLKTFKDQFEKYLKYCNSYNLKNLKNLNIANALTGLKILNDIKNDTTNINEYMKDLNELKYHYILRKIGDITIIKNFKEKNITFNNNILSKYVKENETTLDAKIEELKKTIIDLLNTKYFNAKNVKKVIDYNEYFKYAYYNNKEKNYYNDKDIFKNIFKEYDDDIYSYKKIATVTIDEDNKYVIFSKNELTIRYSTSTKELYFTKTNDYTKIKNEKLDFIIACVV